MTICVTTWQSTVTLRAVREVKHWSDLLVADCAEVNDFISTRTFANTRILGFSLLSGRMKGGKICQVTSHAARRVPDRCSCCSSRFPPTYNMLTKNTNTPQLRITKNVPLVAPTDYGYGWALSADMQASRRSWQQLVVLFIAPVNIAY